MLALCGLRPRIERNDCNFGRRRDVRRSRSFDRREIRTTRERSRGEVQGGGFILDFYGAREQTLGLQRQPYFLLVYQSTPSQQAHL